MGLMYGLYTGENIDYGSILWAQFIQSTLSITCHSEISCARIWTVVVNRAIKQLNITVMIDALIASIATFHTKGIIMADRSKFDFIGSIMEAMFRDVPPSSKIPEGYRALTPSEEQVRTEEVEQVRTDREVTPPINDFVPSPPPSPKTTTSIPITIAPLPSVSSQTHTTIPVSIPIFTDSTLPPQTSTAPECSVTVCNTGANTSGFSTHVTPPISPICTDDPEMPFGDDYDDDLEAFSFSPFQITVDNED
uniref:Uncharacterized protein n=1 Tax=Lactuca sativa TaxID=4236 RepID=A0A9R1X7P8_LACSA|nr:hypothetical protein LSAT_V11C600329060 [Lactuca sativa]